MAARKASLAVLARGAGVWRGRRCALALWRWAEVRAQRVRIRAALRRAAGDRLAIGFDAWGMKAAAAAGAKARRRGALKRWRGGSTLARALSQWRSQWMRHRTAEWSMLRVHASFVHSSLRRAMTTWVAYAEERRLAEEKARAVVVRLSPEGRAVGRALNRWSAAGRRRRATLRALAAVVHRRTVAAVNTWRDVAADATARRRRLSSALHRMTPEGRAQARALARARRRPRGAAAAAPRAGGAVQP